jgi:hypothetical protein
VGDEHRARPAWRPWTIWLPGLLALAVCGLLVVADALAGVMGSWDTPAPGLAWIKAAVIGHCALAAASVAVLTLGVARPPWRRAAAIAAWMIIPAALAWFLLAGRLASAA